MKPICIIPARSGSKSVPKKNIRKLGNHPLISYAIESALNSKLFEHVIVSTEDKTIADIALDYGAEVPFMRPKKLASDFTSTEEVLFHVIDKLKSLNIPCDTIALRDCTVPFIDVKDMRGTVNLFKHSLCDVACTAFKAHPSPYFQMMEFNKKGFLEISKSIKKEIFRRQDTPLVYVVDGFYVFSIDYLKHKKKILSGKILPYEITKEHGHMIDFEFDFKVADLLVKNNFH